MKRRFLKKKINLGRAPGTLIDLQTGDLPAPSFTHFAYNEDHIEENNRVSAEDVRPDAQKNLVAWINVDGVHDVEILNRIGGLFNIHPLILEDIQNTGQRPKLDRSDDLMFVCLKMLRFDGQINDINTEQVSIIFGANFVITFQERQGDVFDPIRQRLRENKGRIRRSGADYLAYSLIDSIVDNYFAVLENIEEQIDSLEDRIMISSDAETAKKLHELKRKMLLIRRATWPLREVISALEKEESSLIHKATRPYLRDVYEHTIQVIDAVETFRDLISGLHDIYLSTVSNNMNSIMKVLTIIATIFIPLTFIAGVYGMNFRHMPELAWWWGYPAVIGVMVIVAVAMMFYFKKKQWL
jgi:magnesium transporter